MAIRFGFDMGTNSIGYSVIELDSHGNTTELIDLGVRIFSDGRNPKDKQPLAVGRRIARGMRRRRDRLLQRKRLLVNQLIRDALFPTTQEEREQLKILDPYVLRKEALDRMLEPYELGRALFHIGTRRGFKSNRISDSKDTEVSSQTDRMEELSKNIFESNSRTLGEYLYLRQVQNQGTRFKGGEFNAYPSREHYHQEFLAIKGRQATYYTFVDWDKIEHIIFDQRPLKQQEKGKCQFYIEEDRAYQALPSAHHFRMAQEINNLRFNDLYGNTYTLDDKEKDVLFSMLDNCKTLSFAKIRTVFNHIEGKFNLEDERREKLLGNETAFTMRNKKYFGNIWDTLTLEAQDTLIEKLLEMENDDTILQSLDCFKLNSEQKTALLSWKGSRKVGKLSTRFMRECFEIMMREHIRYDEAVRKMSLHHSNNPIVELQPELPYYGKVLPDLVMGSNPEAPEEEPEKKYGKIANPTVHIALNQLRKVTNSLIAEYGLPDQIVMELSRDISDSAETRSKHFSEQAKRGRENDFIRTELKETFNIPFPKAWDIKKYKLWIELGTDSNVRCCPYCGKPIPAYKVFTQEIEIEHILPYSRTMLDSMSNLTVAHRRCNQMKKEQTPYEAFSHNPGEYNWNKIMERAEKLPNHKGDKFLKTAIDDFEQKSTFIARQLNDNRYLSTAAKKYLSSICPSNQVWSIRGQNTSFLRARWGLNTLLSNSDDPFFKNRSDHRHHAVDALVIGLTDRSLIQQMAHLNINKDATNHEVPPFPFKRSEVEAQIRNTLVSHKIDHGHQGRMYKETATGRKLIKTLVPVNSLSEEQVPLLVDESWRMNFIKAKEKGISFRTRRNQIMKKFLEEKQNNNPMVQVYKEVWVTRVPIVDLDATDIKAHRILNKRLDAQISEKTIDVLNDKKLLRERLLELSKEWNIKRVRYIPKGQLFSQIKSVPNKWYEDDGVCYTRIWRVPEKATKFNGEFISYKQAYDEAQGKMLLRPKELHPASKRIMTLYKGDIIKITPKEGQSYLAKVAGYSTTQNKIDIQPIYASGSLGEWKTTMNPYITPNADFWSKVTTTGQNYISINVLFNSNQIELVKINPIGRIVHK
ncbi:MAG: type II CRISPR RNA-guided endonuclease Cas9 [Sphaerochaeta sp.]|nr:type II CRISPR RNA-guided endonuclease Cas9 [Sphaerochaeta sp.]